MQPRYNVTIFTPDDGRVENYWFVNMVDIEASIRTTWSKVGGATLEPIPASPGQWRIKHAGAIQGLVRDIGTITPLMGPTHF